MITYIVSIIVVFTSSAANGFPDKLFRENDNTFKLYSRGEWRAEPPADVVPLNTPVPYVVIHHTYIPGACTTAAECKKSMKSMQTYHNSLGWGDIGYNFCIGSEAGVYEGRGWETKGIHAGKANGVSIGICLIGDWRTELPPQGQLDVTKALIDDGIRLGYIRPDYKLVGHRQVMATECPGGALYHHISKWSHFVPEFE